MLAGFDPFPPAAGPAPALPDRWLARGYSLRPAEPRDLPGLLRLYADTRAEEMAAVPWPGLVKESFLADQFRLQHQHYVVHYAGTQFLVIERTGQLVGRFYLWRGAPADLVVDISLLSAHRGQGLGRALLEGAQASAAAEGRPLRLHVHKANVAARRLYERLGFRIDEDDGSHHGMGWTASG